MGSFFLYFSVANGEPPIGIPWETFQKYIFAKITNALMKEYRTRRPEEQYVKKLTGDKRLLA